MTENALQTAADRFQHWICESALPLWSTVGIETESGAAVERLTAEGIADINAKKRVRVQARQMFVFALAAHHRWLDNAGNYVTRIDRFLQQHAQHPQNQAVYVHLLSADNKVLDARQDTYDLAFFLLANAWRARVFKDINALQRADAILEHIDSEFRSIGGWLEGNYAAPHRRQNPHMHLLEAFLALYIASGEAKWLARAGEIFSLFELHFFDCKQHVLLEYFDANWQPLEVNNDMIVEPGHMLEWVWLLQQYGRLTGTPVDYYTESLYHQALKIGMDLTSGLVLDAVTASGKIVKASKRCWPMTELIKANIALATSGYSECEELAAYAIDALFEYYLSTSVPGSYIDRLDANNNVIDDSAPASTLYHLILAASEVVAYCNTKKINNKRRPVSYLKQVFP